MKEIDGYPVCTGCKYSQLQYCSKYNKQCISLNLKGERNQIACTDCINNDSYEYGDIEIQSQPEQIGYMHLPGPENIDYFEPLIKMREYYPEVFYENREIWEIYGSFSGAIWNGRTPNFGGPSLSIQDIDIIRQRIEDLGLRLNLTWNNHLIKGTDLYDNFCNKITEVFHNGKHAITVASPELFNYLQEKYPNFTYYSSVIPTSNDKEFTIKDDRFDMYLWPRNLNNNWNHLNELPQELRSKIEFLANDACTPICNRMGHYNLVNKCLKERLSEDYYIGTYCTIDHDFMRYNAQRWPMTILPEHIDKYIENGYVHFKLCSRGDIPPILMLKLIPYLVKPEYVEDVFGWCMTKQLVPENISAIELSKKLKQQPTKFKNKVWGE